MAISSTERRASGTTSHHPRQTKLARREATEFYLFISPWIAGFLLFTAGPIAATLLISFTKWDLFVTPQWMWLRNYVDMANDPLFWQSLKVTFVYSGMSIPLGVMASLAVALLMHQKVRGINVFRTIFYLPSVTSGVAIALLWLWMFNPEFGLINWVLSLVGIHGPEWIYSREWAVPAFVLMSLWGIGGNMIIYLAALEGVPTTLYEAATLDGAGEVRKFFSVTLPMITPVVLFNLIMSIINSFQVFTSSYVMTNGGPAYATLFYVLYLYNNAFRYFNFGYASAMAWILFLIILGLTLVVLRSSTAWVYYEGERRSN